MGKNGTTKKGKQKVPIPAVPSSGLPSQPPLPLPPTAALSPPAAYHIEYPPVTIARIEELEEEPTGPLGGPIEGAEEESWQDVGHSADGWEANVPENSKSDLHDDGSETDTCMTQAPTALPPPPQNMSGGGRDRTRSHYPQQQLPSHPIMEFGPNIGAHNALAASRGYAKPQQFQGDWAPENNKWAGGDGWDNQEDQPSGDDEWGQNDGWNTVNDSWSQQPHSVAWAHAISASASSHAPSRAPTGGWQSWGEEARRLPKVSFDPAIPPSPSSSGSKTVLSQLQRSQILNALLNNPQQAQQPYPMPPDTGAPFGPADANNWPEHQLPRNGNRHQQQQPVHHHHPYEQHHEYQSKKGKKGRPPKQDQAIHPPQHPPRQEEAHDVWGLGDGWSDLHEDEEQDMTQDPWGRRVHFSPSPLHASMLPAPAPSAVSPAVVENLTVNALPQNKLGVSTIPMSKTLSYAYSGSTPSTESEPGRAAMQRITDFQFIESRGEALKGVQQAFYGKQRKAVDRFHWLFPPEKDERVASLLNWINSVSFGIASFGLQKFLQTRERGALIVNAAYRPVHSPSEPAFDWVTWNQIQMTMDRVLQESVGYYNPAMHIIVFVFLPSPSGNSVAIWRRKLPIPNNIRLAYQAQITQALASLRKEYPVFVDELPAPPEPTPLPPPKKKRKWYKLWLSS